MRAGRGGSLTRTVLRAPAQPAPAQLTTNDVEIESDAYGTVNIAYGPVLRINSGASTSTLALQGLQAIHHRSPLTSRASEVRLALDDRGGTLRYGDRIRAEAPGFGSIDRPFTMSSTRAYDPGDTRGRFFLAHGLAAGLPLFSITLIG